jgi:hypothetical protein
MRHPHGETVTVTRAGAATGEPDEQGNPTPAPATSFTVSDVAIAPAGSDETPEAQGVWVVTGYTLYLPYGTVLLPDDRLTIRGVDGWQVEGDSTAAGWRNPFNGLEPGVVVSVRRS